MASASDEADAMYGFAASAVRISPDGLVYRFALRPQARFHDGTKLTAQDAAFTFKLLKDKGHPIIQQRLREMAGVEAADDLTLVVRFVEKRARDTPLFVASLPIFSRAYYTAHNFEETTLDVPLGSGPYKVGRFEPGRYIEYQRVPTGGAPSCRSMSDRTTSTSCATSITGTATSASRASPRRAICFARSSPRVPGRRATISRRFATAARSGTSCRTIRRPARRAGS